MAQTRQDLTGPTDSADFYTNLCGAAMLYCISAPGGLNGVEDDVPIKDKGMMGADALTTRGYTFGNGTSYAAPVVAGAVALVAEVFPWMTNKNLATTILTTGTTAENPSEIWGRGLLDIGRAIQGPGIFEETFDANVTTGYRSTFGNNISGVAGLDKRGAGILIMSGTSTYKGETGVYGGTLQVVGSIATSAVTVYREGSLTGTGTVGTTTVSGIIAPGNSPGTLTIAGNYLQRAGGIYQYEIDTQGKTDLLSVQGTATIEPGAVLQVMNPLRLRLNTGYSLLTATGNIFGKDHYTTPDYILLNQIYSVSTNDARSTLQYSLSRNNTPVALFGDTANQRNVADAIDRLQSGHPLYSRMMLTTDGSTLPGVLDGLNGEIYASTLSVLMNQSSLLLQPVTSRLQNALNPWSLPNGAQAVREEGPDKAVWGQALGGWGKLSGAGIAQSVDSSMGGLLLGSDVALTAASRVGMAAGASSTRVSQAGASSNTMGYHLYGYGGTQGELFGLRGGVGQSWYALNANRTLAYEYGGLAGNSNANSTQLFAEADVTYQVGSTRVRPFVGLTQLWMRGNAFSETETSLVRLSANASQNNVTFTTLGLRADQVFETSASRLRVNGMLGWRNASGAVAPDTTMQLDAGNPFNVSGAPIARNALVMELTVGAHIDQSTVINLSYGGQFGSGMQSNTLQAGLVFSF
jgi:subtilase-type serine protease